MHARFSDIAARGGNARALRPNVALKEHEEEDDGFAVVQRCRSL